MGRPGAATADDFESLESCLSYFFLIFACSLPAAKFEFEGDTFRSERATKVGQYYGTAEWTLKLMVMSTVASADGGLRPQCGQSRAILKIRKFSMFACIRYFDFLRVFLETGAKFTIFDRLR